MLNREYQFKLRQKYIERKEATLKLQASVSNEAIYYY